MSDLGIRKIPGQLALTLIEKSMPRGRVNMGVPGQQAAVPQVTATPGVGTKVNVVV